MSGRGPRKQPHARQRKEGDQGEEEGFLYCLMYYFDEARRESENGDKRSRRLRRCLGDDDDDDGGKNKKKDDDEEEPRGSGQNQQADGEMLNPLVYREQMPGRTFRGSVVRRAYTPDREPPSTRNNSSMSRRAHSQPPEANEEEEIPKFRIRRRR